MNVPLDETIIICADTLYNNPDSQPCTPKEVFVEQLHNATSTVEFSFDNTIYRQINGVAMSSPPGPALTNIFVGYYEEKLFSEISKPAMYFRYVDDTFVIFQNKKESEEFLIRLNGLHFSLQFTFALQNKPILLVGGGNRYQRVTPFFVLLDELKLVDLFRLETAKLKYKFIHNKLPSSFSNYFMKTLIFPTELQELHLIVIIFIYRNFLQPDCRDA